MSQNLPIDVDRINLKITYWGMALNLFIPAVLIGLGLFLKSKGMQANPISSLGLLLVILLTVSIGEIGTIFIIRRNLFRSIVSGTALCKETDLEQILIRCSIIIFSMSLAPCIYGFVYLLLGGTMDWFLVFIAITLLCFMLFKPRPEQIRKLILQTESSKQD
jgi:hypothetical protein